MAHKRWFFSLFTRWDGLPSTVQKLLPACIIVIESLFFVLLVISRSTDFLAENKRCAGGSGWSHGRTVEMSFSRLTTDKTTEAEEFVEKTSSKRNDHLQKKKYLDVPGR